MLIASGVGCDSAEGAASLGCVKPVRALYARFRDLVDQGARSGVAVADKVRLLAFELGKFGVVGVLAFVVTDAGTNLLHFRAGLGPLNANVIATVAAMAVSYAGNRYWTFRNRQHGGVRRRRSGRAAGDQG